MPTYYNVLGLDGTTGQSKYIDSGMISVRTYGAKGDGTTDDTTSIQAAITAAQTGTLRSVFFPTGTYLVTGLTVTGQVRLIGENELSTVIYSTTNAIIVSMIANATSFKGGDIENLTIRGSVSAGSSQIGLKVNDSTYVFNVRVKNVNIELCGSNGLYVGKAFSSTFENVSIADCADYPLLYDANNMPKNVFRNIYIVSLRSTGLAGFRIKAGEFFAYNCNGINNNIAGSKLAVVGRKNGVDSDVSNQTALAHWENCNFEAYNVNAVYHYANSKSTFVNCDFVGTSFSLNGTITNVTTTIALVSTTGLPTSGTLRFESEDITYTALSGNSLSGTITRGANSTTATSHTNGITVYNKSIKPIVYEVDTSAFPAFFQSGTINDFCNFADGPITNFSNNQAVHCNDVPPLQTVGRGPLVALDAPLATYYNSGGSTTDMLKRADGYIRRQTVSTTTTIVNPGVRYIEVNPSSGFTLTIPWAGWYKTQELLIIKDISGTAGTNNVTLATGGGGTINGGSGFTINQNNQSVILVPNETGSGDWRIISTFNATGITGSLAVGRVTLSAGTNSVFDNASLLFDNTNKILSVLGGGTNPYFYASDTTNNISLRMGILAGAPDRAIVGTTTNHPLVFYVNGNEAWTIDTNRSLTPLAANVRDVGSSANTIKDGHIAGNAIFYERTAPGTPSANTVFLYAKDVSGTSGLFFKNDAGTELQVGGSTSVFNNQANTYSTGLQDFSAATLKLPVSAGASPTTSGLIAYDSTSNTLEYGENGTNRTLVNLDGTQTLSNKTFVAPALGTPASGILTSCTGTASGLTAGNVTTNANLTGDITSSGNATTIGSNKVTLGMLATLAANSVIGNSTGSTATPTAVSMLSTATASSIELRDVNANASSNSFITGFATITTAAGTTILTVSSKQIQEFTGSTTQTVTLPVASTLVAGQSFTIINRSSGAVTVNSSGANLVQTIAANSSAEITCVLNSGTTAASWDSVYTTTAGAGDMVLASVQTITGAKTFGSIGGAVGKLIIAGSTSGSTILDATPAAGSGTVTLPTSGTLLTTAGSGASLTNVVNSITGTSNQVVASGATGTVTLSLPQSIATSSTPQFAALGLGQSAPTVGLAITGRTITTDADGTVVGAVIVGTINPPTSDTATKTYPIVQIKPTLNSNTGVTSKTVDILQIDTTNTNTTGLTVNLIDAMYNGTSKFTVDSTGAIIVGIGSGLTALNASNLSSGTVPAARIQEVISVTDLTTYSATSGTGTTAVRMTPTSLLTNDILQYNGTDWINAFNSPFWSDIQSATAGALSLNNSTFGTTITQTTGLWSISWSGNTTSSSMFTLSSGNTSATGYLLDVIANSTSSNVKPFRIQARQADVLTTDASGAFSFSTKARTGTNSFHTRFVTPADTSLTASTEIVGMQFGGSTSAATVTKTWLAGALTTQRENLFIAPTYAFGSSSTLTTAATVAINAAPIAGGGPATITNSYALWVQSGRAQFDGTINNVTLTAPASASTLTIGSGKTVAINNSLTMAGTDSTTMTFPSGTGTVLTADSTATLTNKTFDAEGTGNTLVLPEKIYLVAAAASGATAGSCFDLPASSAPTAAVYGTAPHIFGGLNFGDTSSALTCQTNFRLPDDWSSSGAIDIIFHWFSASTSTNSVVWTCATKSIATTEDLISPTFNTTQTVADPNLATANTLNSATIANITNTGLAAGEHLFLRIGRDSANGSDTLAATAVLLGVEITLRRSI